MHTIKIEVGDSIYFHIKFLLKNLESRDLRIIEENESANLQNTTDELEIQMFSNHSANLIEDWKDFSEDELWN